VLVDTHVHVISSDLGRFPLHPPGVNTGPWWETHPCSADLLRLLMEDAGVDRAVLVQGVGAYGFDNEYTLEASKNAPNVFANVVCTDRRAEGASWQRIADEVRERTGVFVTDNTIRVWHLSAEVEPAEAGARAS